MSIVAKLFLGGLVLLVITVTVLSYLGILADPFSKFLDLLGYDQDVAPIEGTAVLVLRDITGNEPVDGLYLFNIYAEKLEKASGLPLDYSTDFIPSIFNHLNSLLAFSNSASSSEPAQIVLLNKPRGTSEFKSVKLTESKSYFKRDITLSGDDDILAFAALDKADPNDDPYSFGPSSWSIFVVPDSDRKEQFVTNGKSPTFGPDRQILFIKDDGIYMTDVNNKSEIKIYDAGENALIARDQLGISLDNNLLALSQPLSQKLRIFSISSWSPFSMSLLKEIDGPGLQPTFSPDGNYVMRYLLVPSEESEYDTVGQIGAYNIRDGLYTPIFTLNGFDPYKTSVAGWRFLKSE